MGPGSSELAQVMEEGSQTVTQLLETVTGEPLYADVISRGKVKAGPDNVLDVSSGHELAHRVAVLKGRRTDLRYLHAQSIYVPERLPADVFARLEATSEPIGRTLAGAGARWAREPIAQPDPLFGFPPSDVPDPSEVVWERAYLLLVAGVPTFAIQEWFLRPVLKAMSAAQ